VILADLFLRVLWFLFLERISQHRQTTIEPCQRVSLHGTTLLLATVAITSRDHLLLFYTQDLIILSLAGTQATAAEEVKIMTSSSPSSNIGGRDSSSAMLRSCGSSATSVPGSGSAATDTSSSSVSRKKEQPNHPAQIQSAANPVLAETFERHWQQLRGIAAHNVSLPHN